jgi:trans-aconitate methyltransferase
MRGGKCCRWLAGQVGSTGRVVAVDLDTRFLEGHGLAYLDVRQHNIVADTMADGSFELAHARAVLEHISDRRRALERMISAVRPGGWLMVEGARLIGELSDAGLETIAAEIHAPIVAEGPRPGPAGRSSSSRPGSSAPGWSPRTTSSVPSA